jgi:hypothetical protein
VLELAAARRPVSQRFGGDMHHDLMAIGARSFDGGVCKETFGHQGEGVRATCAEPNRFRRRSRWNVFHRDVDGFQYLRAGFRG